MAAVEASSSRTQPGTRRGGQRKVRVVIRRVNPWSVLKFALLFNFCLMLVVMVGLGILWAILSSLGVLDTVAELLSGIGFGGGDFQFDTGYIFWRLFLIGFISTILWSAFLVFVAFLYNLVSDLLGGIEVTMTEKR
jgi:hypothetical protein